MRTAVMPAEKFYIRDSLFLLTHVRLWTDFGKIRHIRYRCLEKVNTGYENFPCRYRGLFIYGQ